MGKSYVIKYVAEVSRDEQSRVVCHEMRLQDIIMRYALYNDGVKAGDKIKVWEQVGSGNYIITIKKDIPKPQQDKEYRYTANSFGKNIIWINQWYVPRSYYKKRNATHSEVSF